MHAEDGAHPASPSGLSMIQSPMRSPAFNMDRYSVPWARPGRNGRTVLVCGPPAGALGSPDAARFPDLEGRVALVTGAARGIGAATALALAEAGARVALVDRDAEGIEKTADAIGRAGSDALAIPADVTDAPAIERAVDAVVAEWGRLDVLVNNAGIVRDATLGKVSDDDWTATLDVNLRGTMIGTRAALRPMRAAGAGRILSATSVVARMGNYGQTAYAREQGRHHRHDAGLGARARTLGITRTRSPRIHRHGDGAACRRRSCRAAPARRRAASAPEEVAAVYVFLASDLASFINGRWWGGRRPAR
jgi:3-oxoacyl-[acyl-carrier protein] reductase